MSESLTLQQIAYGVKYRAGADAYTDLHAGGIFFCVIYTQCLQFDQSGNVRRWMEVIDDSREFDDEGHRLRQFEEWGTFHVNTRDHLVCEFPTLRLEGLISTRDTALLAFYATYPQSRPTPPGSAVFRRDECATV